jgi:hypothetical protein
VAQVTLKNPSTHLSFFNRVSLRKGEGGPEVAPVYWSDNCISLLPGQEKTLTAVFSADDLDGKPPVIRVDGWNSAP